MEQRPFSSDEALLDAFNASMFTEFREVNIGTLDAFMFDYDDEFKKTALKDNGMSDELATNILKLGNLYRTRTQALLERNKRCTIFSPSQRDAIWGSFTARQISNADGSETMQSYAKLYEGVATQRLTTMQAIGRATLERLFPEGSPELTTEQRMRVVDKLQHETRPAMMTDTLLSALDEATGSAAASMKLKDAIERLPRVGGGYSADQPVRDADETQILDMWNKIRAFITREYSGYRVDIAALVPPKPKIVSTGDNLPRKESQLIFRLNNLLDRLLGLRSNGSTKAVRVSIPSRLRNEDACRTRNFSSARLSDVKFS